MRFKIVAAAALVAIVSACGAQSGENKGAPQAAAAPSYTLDVFAREQEQIYLVSYSDGKVAAARSDGADHSEIIAPEEAHRLLDERQQEFRSPEHQAVNVEVGGVKIAVSGSGDDNNGGKSGEAHIDVNAGGHGMTLDAQGDDENGRARVHITGADAEAARKFINDAEHLSPDVKQQMLQELGL
ncbi:MAG: hypothetical protein ABUS57_18760 [Pseudomonadota bacterium]